MRICRRCGATLTEGIDWCGQCSSRAGTFSSGEVLGELAEMWSPYVPPAPHRTEPRPVRRISRWGAGATTVGGRGRIALTALFAGGWLVPFVLLAVTSIGPLLLLTYTIITLPGTVLIVKDVWREESVIEPSPPASECATCGAPRRHRAQACHVCFASYEARPVKTYSRTQAGPTTFGPSGRWLMTMGVFGLFFGGLIYAAVLGPATMIVFIGAFSIICVVLLRAVWARVRIR